MSFPSLGDGLSTALDVLNLTTNKPIVIGIYGVSGCGKSYLLKQLKAEFGSQNFQYYDGSEVIERHVSMVDFKKMDKEQQKALRNIAIEEIQKECAENGQTGVVTGHCMFWNEGDESPEVVWTTSDGKIYTHIFYLSGDPSVIKQQRENDLIRARRADSADHLEKLQNAEIIHLR